METVLAWLRQPTSVAGISTLFGTVSALLTQQMSWIQAMPLIVGGLASIALPDNAGTKASAELLARAIAAEIQRGKNK